MSTSMDSNSRTGLSCRKLLNESDCTSIFQIPSQFVNSLGQKLPPKATLRIDQSGKCWNVKIEKFKDHYFFTDGWEQFAQAVDIKSWEFLVLNSAGFGSESNSGEENDSVLERQDAPCDEKEWIFTKELKKNNAYRLVLPRKFAVETGIATTKNIKLKDAEGRKWPVRVYNSCGDIAMGAGWRDFLIANNVIVGSIILFKFVSCSNMMMEAQMVKEGLDRKALFNCVKRKRTEYEVVASCNASEGTDKKAVPNYVETKWENCEAGSACKTSACEEESTNMSFKPTCERKDFGGGGRLSFSKKLKEYHVHMMAIPKEFVIGTGINKDRTIKLKDVEGREWPVRATAKNSGMFSFTAGWSKFLVGNKVVVGSTMYFESNSDNAIEARVIKMGTDEKALFSCVRRNGGKFEVSTSHKRSNHANLTISCSPDAACINSKLSFSKELEKHDAYTLGSLPDESNHAYMELNSGEDKVVKVGTDENALFSRVKRNTGEFQVSTSHKSCSELTTNSTPDANCANSKLSFSKELKKYHLYELSIPEDFARRTGIAKLSEVKLKNGEGRKWTVQVTERFDRVFMSSGWSGFLKENNVVVGSTISFVRCSDNTIETHIAKEVTDSHELFKFVRTKGRRLELIKSKKRDDHVMVHKNPVPINENGETFLELKQHNAYKLDLTKDIGELQDGSGLCT